jgi:hypothetical protein
METFYEVKNPYFVHQNLCVSVLSYSKSVFRNSLKNTDVTAYTVHDDYRDTLIFDIDFFLQKIRFANHLNEKISKSLFLKWISRNRYYYFCSCTL